jgi:hypothetical protein
VASEEPAVHKYGFHSLTVLIMNQQRQFDKESASLSNEDNYPSGVKCQVSRVICQLSTCQFRSRLSLNRNWVYLQMQSTLEPTDFPRVGVVVLIGTDVPIWDVWREEKSAGEINLCCSFSSARPCSDLASTSAASPTLLLPSNTVRP